MQEDHIYHDKNVSLVGVMFHRLEMNHRLGYGNAMKDHKIVPFMETNLIDLDDPTNSEVTFANPKEVCLEIEVRKKWVVEEEAKHIHLEKEREKATLNVIIERTK